MIHELGGTCVSGHVSKPHIFVATSVQSEEYKVYMSALQITNLSIRRRWTKYLNVFCFCSTVSCGAKSVPFVQAAKTPPMIVPVVRPTWVQACHTAGRKVSVKGPFVVSRRCNSKAVGLNHCDWLAGATESSRAGTFRRSDNIDIRSQCS